MEPIGKCGRCGHRWSEHRRIDADAGEALHRKVCEGRSSRYIPSTGEWSELDCSCLAVVPKAVLTRSAVRTSAWSDGGENDILCRVGCPVLARGVPDAVALRVARGHVEVTGHPVARLRMRSQRFYPASEEPFR